MHELLKRAMDLTYKDVDSIYCIITEIYENICGDRMSNKVSITLEEI